MAKNKDPELNANEFFKVLVVIVLVSFLIAAVFILYELSQSQFFGL